MRLPIDDVLPQLNEVLASGSNAVLVAEPGAGKTTKVPLYCLDSAWLKNQKIMMLEPRRLAARSAVSYMSASRGEKIGETLGYRVRGESKVGPETRIEVVTEGILTRIIQSQPELEGVGLVIFDEFHERSLHADLALALCLEIQRSIRPDLRILVMSATLDAENVAKLIGADSIIKSSGRNFPVQINYLSEKSELPLDRLVSDSIRRALRETEGDILVFLPGRGEISWVAKRLEEKQLPVPAQVLTLFSDMTSAQQDLVLRSREHNKRKIILSTSIAETSLTIDGVKVVIDSGQMRVPRFDANRGMSGLETVTVSQASAEQRMGRAGRQEAGTCYRLWTQNQQRELPRFNEPEILQTDLANLALELALWGQIDPGAFSFLTPPPDKTFQQAKSLLCTIGAVDSSGRISDHGRELSKLGVHPRIAHMLVKARKLGVLSLACDVAALLEEKSVLNDRAADLEMSSRWHALERFKRSGNQRESRSAFSRVSKEADRLRKVMSAQEEQIISIEDLSKIGVLTALAYPDRIAKRRDDNHHRYLTRNGSGASLPDPCLLSRNEYLAIAQLDGSSQNGKIFLCEPIEEREIIEYFGREINLSVTTRWEEREQAVKSQQQKRLGAIIISELQLKASAEEILFVLLAAIKQMEMRCLAWTETATSLKSRNQWLRTVGLVDENWPDLSQERLVETLDLWLGPFLNNISSAAQLQKLDLNTILLGLFSWQQRKQLDNLAPTHWLLPTGTNALIDYDSPSAPMISVRLQEMLGQSETPKIGNGKFPLTIELLSPARRPLQITKDLASFWKNGYLEVRKEMQGRYPRHVWPLDPSTALPTRRVKRHNL